MVIVVDGKGLIAHPFVDDSRRAGGVGAVDAQAVLAVPAEAAGDVLIVAPGTPLGDAHGILSHVLMGALRLQIDGAAR